MLCSSRWKRQFVGQGRHGGSLGFTDASIPQDIPASFTITPPRSHHILPTTTLSGTTSSSPTTTFIPQSPRYTNIFGSTSQVNQFATTIPVSVPASIPAFTAVAEQRSGSRSKIPGIIGGVAGSLAALILITLTILCIRRKWLRAPPCIRRKLREKDGIVIGASEEGGETACNTRPSELGGGITPQNTLGDRARSMEPTNEPEPMDTGSQEPSGTENPFVVVENTSPSPFTLEQRTQKASQMRQVRRQSTNWQPPELQDQGTFSAGHLLSALSATDREFTTSGSSIQEISLLMQEMDNMRSRMAEIVRRQQEETAVRNSTLATLAPSDGDDRQTEPPAYSELGES